MRVLVTRPGDDGTVLAELLGARGVESVVEPLLAIKQVEGPPGVSIVTIVENRPRDKPCFLS